MLRNYQKEKLSLKDVKPDERAKFGYNFETPNFSFTQNASTYLTLEETKIKKRNKTSTQGSLYSFSNMNLQDANIRKKDLIIKTEGKDKLKLEEKLYMGTIERNKNNKRFLIKF